MSEQPTTKEISLGEQLDRNKTTAFLLFKGSAPSEDISDELPCLLCNGPLYLMGTLGYREWFRCRNCGMDYGREIPRPTTEYERHPADWGPAPRKAAVAYITSLTLAQNRTRQQVIRAQMRSHAARRNPEIMRDLQAMYDLETEAIDRREFPRPPTQEINQ